MKTLRKIRNPLICSVVGLALTILTLGAALAPAPPAEAMPPLLCGPTYQWSCSGPGGPDVLFIGTVCEKNEYEQQTGRTCVPI